MAVTIKSATTIKSSTTVGFQPGSLFAAGEQGVWYDPSDLTTMFSDAAGANGVAAPGSGSQQLVGSVLDKRNLGASTSFNGTSSYLGATLSSAIATSDYTIECWMYVSSASSNAVIYDGNSVDLAGDGAMFIWASGTIRFRFIGNGNPVVSASGYSLNTWYHLAIVKSGTGSNNVSCYINGALVGQMTYTTSLTSTKQTIGTYADRNAVFFPGLVSNLRVVKGTAVYTSAFTPPIGPLQPITGTLILTCGNAWSGNPTFTLTGPPTLSNVNPFGASTGNHATQSTAGNRPELSARVNLLTKTEQFNDTSAWTARFSTPTIVAASETVAPNGTATANLLTADGSSNTHDCGQNITTASNQRIFSIYFKAGTNNFAQICGGGDANVYANFNISTGTAGNVGSGNTSAITSVGNGWYRCSITTSSSAVSSIYINIISSNTAARFEVTTLSTTIYLWGADLRVSNDGVGLPVYQRVNTSTDYDTTGFPFYLAFDGSNDGLATSSVDFTSTNKMSVFAGERKLDTTGNTQFLVELSASLPSNNGTFNIPTIGSGTDQYRFFNKGTTAVSATTGATAYNSPDTRVITGLGDISTPSVTLRLNGSLIQTVTTSLGTGNYGNYPLYIGARGGSSLYWNGRIYSLIVRGAPSTSDQITATENWVNTKTRAYSV